MQTMFAPTSEKIQDESAVPSVDSSVFAEPASKSTSFVIVEDHPLVRESLELRLATRPDWRITGEAETVEQAMQIIEQQQPDIVLVDIALSGGNGLELIRDVRSRFPQIKLLVISGYQEPMYVERAKKAGAHGYINKREAIPKLMSAIEGVLTGDQFVTGDTSTIQNRPSSPDEKLSPRELEIFRMIGNGIPSGTIAKNLFISSHTIDTHRENIKRKIGANNAAELSRLAVLWVQNNE